MVLDAPILLVIFNRPYATERVFEKIRAARPKELYIAADGPRASVFGEKEKCAETRNIVARVDWSCKVCTNFSDVNIGLDRRMSSAIDWFFNCVEDGIILEDDCLVADDFFSFCVAMLDRYKDEPNVMMISGMNVVGEWNVSERDYFFSVYGGIWGWASWRRAWKLNDHTMKLWQDRNVRQVIRKFIGNDRQYAARKHLFNAGFKKNVWEYQWSFARMAHGGLSVVPSKNLIINVGFGGDATHTKIADPITRHLTPHELKGPFRGPLDLRADREYDAMFFGFLHPEYQLLWPVRMVWKVARHLLSWIR